MEEKIILKRPPKSGFLAGLLSCIFPGLGSLYNRQVTKGLMFMVIFAGLVTMQASVEVQPFAALVLAGFAMWYATVGDKLVRAEKSALETGQKQVDHVKDAMGDLNKKTEQAAEEAGRLLKGDGR